MEIVTGFQGKNHVTASQISRLLKAAIGPGAYILGTQDGLAAEMLSANTVRIATGDLIVDGTLFTNEAPEELTIENGVTGLNRNDIVINRYSKADPPVDEDGNLDYTVPRVESGSLAIVKGTPTSGEAEDPTLAEAPIGEASTDLAETALWRIPVRGLSVGTPEPMTKTWIPDVEFRESQSQAMRAGTIVGSKVVMLNSQGTARLMTDAELEAAIGRRFDVARGDCCVVMDGDMGSVTVPISTHYSQTVGGVWVHFNGAKDALVRCNWTILYRL